MLALAYAVGSVSPEDVADIAQHPEVIAETRGGQLMTTTKTVLRDEVSLLQFAKDGQRRQKPFIWNDNLKGVDFDIIRNGPIAGLSEEQKKAALHILNSRDTVTGIVGKAGTGKTRMMRATVDSIKTDDAHRVSVFATSAQARDVLKKEGFAEAETLAMLLKSEKLQQEKHGHVVWVDEAGLVSSRDMRQLMDLAKRNGNRVILSGDYTQHASVEAGDSFRRLEMATVLLAIDIAKLRKTS